MPEGAVTGTVKVEGLRQRGRDARERAAEDRRRGRRSPTAGDFQLTSAEATPRKTYFDGVAAPTAHLPVPGREPPPTSGSRSSIATRGRWSEPGSTRGRSPTPRNSARWNGRTDGGGLAANGEYAFRIGNAAGGAAEGDRGLALRLLQVPLPDRRQAQLRRRLRSRPRPPGPGRVREVRRDAARRPRRPGAVEQDPQRRRQLPGHRRQGHADGLHVRAPASGDRRCSAGDRVRTGQRIGLVGETGNASRLPPALRGLVGARLVRGRARAAPRSAPCSRPGTPGAERGDPAGAWRWASHWRRSPPAPDRRRASLRPPARTGAGFELDRARARPAVAFFDERADAAPALPVSRRAPARPADPGRPSRRREIGAAMGRA